MNPDARTGICRSVVDPGADGATSPGSGGMGALVAVVLGSAFCAAVVLVIHARNPITLVSTHGYLHAAIAQRFDGVMPRPPENPYFAGEPICYYWFFHYLAALVGRVAGVDPLHAMEWLIVGGMAILAAFAVQLGRQMHGRVMAGCLIGYLVLAGANPFGPLIWLARVATHDAGAFRDDPVTIFGPYVYASQVSGLPGLRLYGPNFAFFLHVTSRPVALALLLAVAFYLRDALRRATVRSSVGLTLSAALCIAINPLIGLAGVLAVAAAVGLSVLRAPRHADTGPFGARLWAIVLLLLAASLAFPTFSGIVTHRQAGTRFILGSMLGLQALLAVLVGAGPLILLAWHRVRTQSTECDFERVLLWAAVVLLVAASAFSLPEGNAHNFFNAAMTLLAVPAAGAALRRSPDGADARPGARCAGLALCFLPNVVLLTWAYTGRAPVDVAFAGQRIVRTPPSSPRAMLYDWLSVHAPSDAVLVADPRKEATNSSNLLELPAMTDRVLFIGPAGYMTDPYPDAVNRRAIATALVIGQRLGAADRDVLARLRRPVYVISHQADDPSAWSRLDQTLGPALLRKSGVAVFEWSATRYDAVSNGNL